MDDLELNPITDHSEAPVVVHGTYHECWPYIKAQVSAVVMYQRMISKFAKLRSTAKSCLLNEFNMCKNIKIIIFISNVFTLIACLFECL